MPYWRIIAAMGWRAPFGSLLTGPFGEGVGAGFHHPGSLWPPPARVLLLIAASIMYFCIWPEYSRTARRVSSIEGIS